MKKTYSKPEIMFEDFSISTNISVGCETIVNATVDVCAVEFVPGVMTIFLDESICSTPIVDGDPKYNGLCYHNPTPSNNVFTS